MQSRRGPVAGATALVAGATALVTGVLLAGCSPSADPASSSRSADPASSAGTSAPPGLTATLYQSRMDVDDRQVQVRLQNAGGEDVVVERMTLASSAFTDPMVYRKRGSRVPAGRAVDMPVVLSEPVCDGAPMRHTARVEYRLEDGGAGTVDLPAVDEHGAVTGLHEAECFALEVGEVATLSVRGLPRLVVRDGVLTAQLVVDVTADGPRAGDLQVLHLGNTTLLQHVDPTTLEPLVEGLAVEVGVDAPGDTRSFTATLAPGRCDAHAVADDKQGTRFRVRVELDGRPGVVPLVSPDPVKVALYDFVREACDGRTTPGS